MESSSTGDHVHLTEELPPDISTVADESADGRRTTEMAPNPDQSSSDMVNQSIGDPNQTLKTPNKDEIDLKIYENGTFENAVLRGILERLSRQFTILLRQTPRSSFWKDPNNKDPDLLQAAVEKLLEALYLPLPGHPLRLVAMDSVAAFLSLLYDWRGNPEAIKESIVYAKGALSLCPEDLPQRPLLLERLVDSSIEWFKMRRDVKPVQSAASYVRKALEAQPPEYPPLERAQMMNRLGRCLIIVYDRTGEVQHMEESMQWLQMAQRLLPSPDHPLRADILFNLANCLTSQNRLSNKIESLNQSIEYLREAVALNHARAWDRERSTNNLGVSLITRYDQLGEVEDLEEAIRCFREILLLHPVGHTNRLNPLLNLASCLRAWSEQRGGSEELDEAIQHLREVLTIATYPNLDRANALAKLGNCFYLRFLHEKDVGDLEDGIQSHRQALLLVPRRDPERVAILSNLSYSLSMQYRLQRNVDDLDEAIQSMREALSLCHPGHSLKPDLLNHLADRLKARFDHGGDVQYLQDAIQYHREALTLGSPGHRSRPGILHNLSSCLKSRYRHSGAIQDLKEAVECLREIIHTIDPIHTIHCKALSSLASMYADNAEALEPFYDTADVPALFEKASNHPTAGLLDRLLASQSWINAVHGSQGLSAYKTCLRLMDQFLLLRPSLTSRHQLHREIPQDTVLDAAATAIECGEVETAVEFLEQGRTLLWSQMNRYRTPLDELQRAHPKLATDFTRLSQLLENSATSGITRELCKMTLEEETRRYRKIAEDWSTVVDQIRQMDGFENFLRPPDYSFLRLSSRKGPVIMINVGSKRCDAIIIHQENNPVLVPLLDVRKSDIQVNAEKFHSETRAGVVDRSQILGVLRALWDDIVQPVVTKLHELNVVPGSRIWWCPTSVLSILPIHAAGPHRRNKLNLCDIYISSYTPTLSTLVGLNPAIPPVGQQNQLHYDPRLLVVAQPDTPGQVHIPGVNKELSAIKMHVPDSNVLLSGGGTSDAVLTGLKTHSWVHITCHGSQDFKDPFASCFHLYDKSLTLLDIIDARAPSAEFGFLSACHSAASDIRRPDETLHLAAALQFTGFRSVIGTMYAMADVDGPIVAEEVYKHMYRRKEKSGSVDYRDAAEGLSIATKKLKERGVPVERWINFVHFGA